jgi:hypothetical protein
MKQAGAFLLGALAAAAASAQSPPDPLAVVSAHMEGAFSNQAQFAAAPDSLKRPPVVGHPYDWLDAQHAVFARVEAPLIGPQVYYLEWRRGGPEGPVSRQRIWSFRRDEAGRAVMDFYTINDAAPFVGKAAAPGAFATLSRDQLYAYPPPCVLDSAMEGETAVFRLRQEKCQVRNARTGRMIALDAVIRVSPAAIEFSELGVWEDGSIAFKVPGGPPYRFERVAR